MRRVIALLFVLTALVLVACATQVPSAADTASASSVVDNAVAADPQYEPECEILVEGNHTLSEGMMVQATVGDGFYMGDTFIRSAEAAMTGASNTVITVPAGGAVRSCTWAQ